MQVLHGGTEARPVILRSRRPTAGARAVSFVRRARGAVGIGLVGGVTLLFLLLMLLPLVSLAQFSGISRLLKAVSRYEGWKAIRLSLLTTAFTSGLTLTAGLPVAFVLSRLKSRRIVRAAGLLCQLPISLPPSVAGISLLILFGKYGIVGRILIRFGVQVAFTQVAVVIAQFFVAAPLFIQIVRTAADQVPEELYEVALVNGADPVQTIVRYVVPMLRPSIVSGLTVAYVRALGEFGATLLFAGNMRGVTTTMPLQIYTLMESDVRLAAGFALVLLSLAAVMVALARTMFGRE